MVKRAVRHLVDAAGGEFKSLSKFIIAVSTCLICGFCLEVDDTRMEFAAIDGEPFTRHTCPLLGALQTVFHTVVDSGDTGAVNPGNIGPRINADGVDIGIDLLGRDGPHFGASPGSYGYLHGPGQIDGFTLERRCDGAPRRSQFHGQHLYSLEAAAKRWHGHLHGAVLHINLRCSDLVLHSEIPLDILHTLDSPVVVLIKG